MEKILALRELREEWSDIDKSVSELKMDALEEAEESLSSLK